MHSDGDDGLVRISDHEATLLRDVLANARAPATKRAYGSDLRAWGRWCEDRGLSSAPTTSTALLLYLGSLLEREQKLSTINRAVVSIELAHARAGGASLRAELVVKEYLKGLRRRLRQQGRREAAPLMIEDLRRILTSVPTTTRKGLRDRAMLLAGWFGALRRSEIVALDIEDVRFDARGAVLRIRSSKTDQDGEGAVLGLPRRRDELCPVEALRAWIAARDKSEERALFVVVGNRDRGRRLAPQAVERVLSSAGGAGFSPHSLRAGFATSAARAGKSAHAIQRQTRHASLAMLGRYIREGELFVSNAGDGL